jgi:hypothetical protein
MDTSKIDTYEALLANNAAKKAERSAAEEVVRQRAADLKVAQAIRSGDVKKLLKLKEGLDLRRAEKEDRRTRTTYLHDAGLLLPTEEIRKIRVNRIHKGVAL